MATVSEILRDTLDNLRAADLKRFRHYLGEEGIIPKGKLEKADSDDVAELMADKYGAEKGGLAALNILKKMKETELATGLERALKEIGIEVQNGGASKEVGAGVQGTHGGTSISATSGGSVNAHQVSNCTFSGNVNFG